MKSSCLMKNHFLLSLIFAFTMMICPEKTVAQVCGGGIFTLEFYTENGEKELDFTYEIYQVDPEALADIYTKFGYEAKFEYNPYHGTIIEEKYAQWLLDFQVETTESKEEFNKILEMTGNKTTGLSKGSKIEFQTIETYLVPYLLKITSEKKHVYIVSDLLGGCDRATIVVWNKYPILLNKPR